MESEANPPWIWTTNWSIVHGSLLDSITFESSLSPIDGDDAVAVDDDDNDNGDLNSTAKQPLILKPKASDSGPCEITISFAQKHEVQQIYVRSSARVYEIYYESNPQSGKEYLSTVRCGIAARDEEVLHAIDNEEVLSAYAKEAHDNSSKEILRNDGNRSSEDEWVEVKVQDTSALGTKDNALPLVTQDYFEATAQISDAHPCLSITLRLLSLQSKDSVYVDEVYVFADPVDSIDSEKEVDQRENSSGNSLMAMLLPTLLQMSKTKSATRMEDKYASEAREKQNFEENGSGAAYPVNVVASTVQQEGNSSIDDPQKIEFQDMNKASVSAAQIQSPVQVSLSESKADLPQNDRVERALDQLSSRMGRIEDLFLRLEENLLKPIYSIEARLNRVEQQLEVLTNKEKNSELPTCTRFCAPNFSSVQSDSNSFYHSEIDYPRCEESGSNIKSFHSDVQTNTVNAISDSVNATQLLPSLVVTAPEFSACDDEEKNQASEGVHDSSVDKPRHALTVDDALASALAGFVSSISVQAQDHIPTLSVRAPEFPCEEDTEVDKVASPRGQSQIGTDETGTITGSLPNASHLSSLDSERNVVRSVDYDQSEKTADHTPTLSVKAPEFPCEEDTKVDKVASPRGQSQIGNYETGTINGSLSNASHLSSLDSERNVVRSVDYNQSEKTAGEVDGQYQHYEGGEKDEPSGELKNKNDEQAYCDKEHTEFFQTTRDTENGEVSTKANNGLIHDQIDAISDTKEEDATSSSDSVTAFETSKKGPEKDVLSVMFEFSHAAASVVDFKSSVLDVKFVSQNSCDRNCPLKALLSNFPGSKSEETCVEESCDTPPTNENRDLISVEDGEPCGSPTNGQIHVDFDCCSLPEPLSREGETPPLASKSSGCPETSAVSLI